MKQEFLTTAEELYAALTEEQVMHATVKLLALFN